MCDHYSHVMPKVVAKDFLEYFYSFHCALLVPSGSSVENDNEEFDIAGGVFYRVDHFPNVLDVFFGTLVETRCVYYSRTLSICDIASCDYHFDLRCFSLFS